MQMSQISQTNLLENNLLMNIYTAQNNQLNYQNFNNFQNSQNLTPVNLYNNRNKSNVPITSNNENKQNVNNFNDYNPYIEKMNIYSNNNPTIKKVNRVLLSEYEGENLNPVWSGNLTKNYKDKVHIVAYKLQNDCLLSFKDVVINIEYRTTYEDVLKRTHKGIIVFSPLNESQTLAFQEYINYLNQRQRVGIAYLKNNVDLIYILAPSEFSMKFYRSSKKYLLGIFVDKRIGITGVTNN